MEEVEAIYVTLSGSEVPGEGINQDSDIFRQAMDHVLRNYGNAALHASDKAGTDSVWVKAKGFASSVLARKRVLARGDEEIPERELEAAILSMPLKLRPAASGELEDESA